LSFIQERQDWAAATTEAEAAATAEETAEAAAETAAVAPVAKTAATTTSSILVELINITCTRYIVTHILVLCFLLKPEELTPAKAPSQESSLGKRQTFVCVCVFPCFRARKSEAKKGGKLSRREKTKVGKIRQRRRRFSSFGEGVISSAREGFKSKLFFLLYIVCVIMEYLVV